MSVTVDAGIPAGNIRVCRIDGFEVTLDRELRDTATEWFFWLFRARFQAPGRYRFHFVNGAAIGTRGPAVSTDAMRSWEWLGVGSILREPDGFVYNHDASRPAEVIFCVGMEYLEQHLTAFMAGQAGKPWLRREVLCRSRQGRKVELITVADAEPAAGTRLNCLLTCRHHACEMMAGYVLEGALAAAAADDAFGRDFRKRFNLFAVPFVDKDGVENGDQGKNRRPHDHNRDYGDATGGIYPETTAIKALVRSRQMAVFVDLHCPWLHGGRGGAEHEYIHFVGNANATMQQSTRELSTLVERESQTPFRADDLLPYGCSYNHADGDLVSAAQWAGTLEFMHLATSLEIPYANVRETTLTAAGAREFGRALAAGLAADAELDRKKSKNVSR